jgi:hypothetical protein
MIKEKLIQQYVDMIVEHMDLDDVVQYTTDGLTKQYKTYSKKALLEEIKETYPNLLDDHANNKPI